MSMPSSTRPWWEATSPRSISVLRMTIVLLMAMTPPKKIPSATGQPSSSPSPSPAAIVSATWAAVPMTATPRTAASSLSENSMPRANIRKMTPTSARAAIWSRSPMKPGVKGPMTMPATR